jgi:hypothetical protein
MPFVSVMSATTNPGNAAVLRLFQSSFTQESLGNPIGLPTASVPSFAASASLRLCGALSAKGRLKVSQRSIEILIGRLITDEAFRSASFQHPRRAVDAFVETGHELTATEIDAIATVAREFWHQAGAQIDPRLQKASLSTHKR